MEKEDLREFSDRELSLQVYNTEYLYRMRGNLTRLFNELDAMFFYTDEQKDELLIDLEEEEKAERDWDQDYDLQKGN